jgi:hypothetical protein
VNRTQGCLARWRYIFHTKLLLKRWASALYPPEIRFLVATVTTANNAASRRAPPGDEAIRPLSGDRLQTQHARFYSSKKLLANLGPVQ